jgi:hypothetical protein
MDHIFESLLEYAGGTNRNDSVRLLANKPLEDGISICIFELGGYEQMFVASVFKTGDGSIVGTLRLRVGQLNRQTQLNRLRISDFLSGKYINYAPRPQVNFDEDQDDEIWIEFDSLSSYYEPDLPSNEEELLNQLVTFLDEARGSHSAILEWQSDLEETQDAMVSKWTGGLEDPIRESSYLDDTDMDEFVALANYLTQKLVFRSNENLRFETLKEAEQFLIDQIPESLDLVCEHDGAVLTFENALRDIRNRSFPWIGGISFSVS